MLLVWNGGVAALVNKTLNATTPGSYSLTGTDVALTKSGAKILVADSGSYLLSGSDVSLTAGSNNKSLIAAPGAYLLTGTDGTFVPPPPVTGVATRGEWPEKARKKRRVREDARAESVQAARQARDALREALARMLEGGPYDAPAIEEAQVEAYATVNALNRLPYLPVQELQIADDLIRSIQALQQQRRLLERQEQEKTDRAVALAQAHLNETMVIANELYRKTRFNYLATAVLMMAE